VAPPDQGIVAGGTYYLPCVAFSRSGRAIEITWSADGKQVTGESPKLAIHERNFTKNGTYFLTSLLELSCVSSEDAVEYSCFATDGIESREETFTLHFSCKLEIGIN
jgi:hypothetical protein